MQSSPPLNHLSSPYTLTDHKNRCMSHVISMPCPVDPRQTNVSDLSRVGYERSTYKEKNDPKTEGLEICRVPYISNLKDFWLLLPKSIYSLIEPVRFKILGPKSYS